MTTHAPIGASGEYTDLGALLTARVERRRKLVDECTASLHELSTLYIGELLDDMFFGADVDDDIRELAREIGFAPKIVFAALNGLNSQLETTQ